MYQGCRSTAGPADGTRSGLLSLLFIVPPLKLSTWLLSNNTEPFSSGDLWGCLSRTGDHRVAAYSRALGGVLHSLLLPQDSTSVSPVLRRRRTCLLRFIVIHVISPVPDLGVPVYDWISRLLICKVAGPLWWWFISGPCPAKAYHGNNGE